MTELQVEIQGLKETQARMEQIVADLHGAPFLQGMHDATLLVTRDAKRFAPVDTGRLRASIVPEVRASGSGVVGVVGSNVKYACIFDAETRITTDSGHKTIGQIEVGDRVLTQSGEYRCVTAKTKFPVTQKPNLVDIEIEWRAGGTHKITVTEDHKVLVYRDGRNKWVMAGDLLITDRLYSRKKIAHNLGTGYARTCVNCGIQYQYDKALRQGKKFCSVKCKYEYWNEKGHNPHIGTKRSAEARKNISDAAKRKILGNPELHPSRIVAKQGFVTSHERQIRDWLLSSRMEFTFQESIGSRVVDFYLPDTQTILEADGAFWHREQAEDIERDKELLERIPDATIIHVHFVDARFTPQLDHNPLPNVYYVAVNPGMSSYTDPVQFETRAIVSVSPWRYKLPRGRAGAKVPNLYDLTIEGVHSFLANGILVSNSFVELGTRPHFVPGKYIGGWAARHGFFKGAKSVSMNWGLRVKGTAHKFLQRAFTENSARIVQLLGDTVGKIVRAK